MELQEIILPKSVDGLQLPDPGMLDYFRLAENRIYYIDFEIDMSILDIQREIIYINVVDAEYPIDERIPIKILIDSPGGLLAGSRRKNSVPRNVPAGRCRHEPSERYCARPDRRSPGTWWRGRLRNEPSVPEWSSISSVSDNPRWQKCVNFS